ncbi:metalloregulator ArsR/SmtB family transcription factor [Tistrella bauzanensis]|uniref:metalloregulator ArsR/SmtB family transcription factor n=1 Tax=Tistrella TaxID=171436 RepID=UPI0031F6D746
MEAVTATRMFQALANETRLAVFRLLMRAEPDGLAAGAIAVCLGVVPSTLSTHLKELERAGLVTVERQGRQLIYRAETGGARALIGFLIADCCGGHPDVCVDLQMGAACGPLAAPAAPRLPIEAQMTDTPQPAAAQPAATLDRGRVYNVLFLCTGNAVRSIMAEALLNHLGRGRFRAFSAGSNPAGQPDPLALTLLERSRIPIEGLRSKNWDEYQVEGAPKFDFVFTVCDHARETCPVWPGQPMTAHWGVPDPAEASGTPAERVLAVAEAFRMLNTRIGIFANLSITALDRLALQKSIDDIGRTAAA